MFFNVIPDDFSTSYYFYSDEPKLSGGKIFYPVYKVVIYINSQKGVNVSGDKTVYDYYDTREKAQEMAIKLNKDTENVL